LAAAQFDLFNGFRSTHVMFLILTMIRPGRGAEYRLGGRSLLVKDKGSDIAILRTMGASQDRSCGCS